MFKDEISELQVEVFHCGSCLCQLWASLPWALRNQLAIWGSPYLLDLHHWEQLEVHPPTDYRSFRWCFLWIHPSFQKPVGSCLEALARGALTQGFSWKNEEEGATLHGLSPPPTVPSLSLRRRPPEQGEVTEGRESPKGLSCVVFFPGVFILWFYNVLYVFMVIMVISYLVLCCVSVLVFFWVVCFVLCLFEWSWVDF